MRVPAPIRLLQRLLLSAALLLAVAGCPAPDAAPVESFPFDPDVSAQPAPALPVHDPLSRPEEPTLAVDAFHAAETCAECHPGQVAQWRTSMHAYAVVDPVFRALVGVRQADFAGEQDQFCMQCHTAIGTRGGEIVDGFSFDELSPVVQEGITCEACHKIAAIDRDYNSGHVLDPAGPMRGPIQDPMTSTFHATEYSPLFEGAQICGACHDVVELSGLHLERPYQEWLESPAATSGRTCQECHMPASTGPAVVGGPERTLHDHAFVGVDLPLADGFVSEEERAALRDRVEALLETAATLTLSAPAAVIAGEQIDLLVTVRNEIDAHNLPTGSTFLRQIWIELVATDAGGVALYRTGDLDANGDLRDYWSALDPYGDDDLISLSSVLVGADGAPELFPWRATEHFSSTIPPLHDRTWTLFVPTAGAVTTPGPIQIEARLRFRTHAPFLLRALGLGHLIERVETYDLASDALLVEVGAAQ